MKCTYKVSLSIYIFFVILLPQFLFNLSTVHINAKQRYVYFWHIFGSDNSSKNNNTTCRTISLQLCALFWVLKGHEEAEAAAGEQWKAAAAGARAAANAAAVAEMKIS